MKDEHILSKEGACCFWKPKRGQAEEPSGRTAFWGSGALKSFPVLSLECRTRYSQWTLKRSTGTRGSRGDSLFKAQNFLLRPATHYNSNEPSTIEGKYASRFLSVVFFPLLSEAL